MLKSYTTFKKVYRISYCNFLEQFMMVAWTLVRDNHGLKSVLPYDAPFIHDKSKYKSIVDLMQRIYTSLNQADKVKLYQAKYDAADGKFIN